MLPVIAAAGAAGLGYLFYHKYHAGPEKIKKEILAQTPPDAMPTTADAHQNLSEMAAIIHALPKKDESGMIADSPAYRGSMTDLAARAKKAITARDVAGAQQVLAAYKVIGTPTANSLATILQRQIASIQAFAPGS